MLHPYDTRVEAMYCIGIDIGTSFIKGALLDLDQGAISGVRRLPCPDRLPGLPPLHYAIDPWAVVAAVDNVLAELLTGAPPCSGLVLCSQMHSLLLVDSAGNPLTSCSTWRDQRTLAPHPAGTGSYFDALCAHIDEQTRSELGNELRPDLPASVLFWLAEQHMLPAAATPLTLPDFVLQHLAGIAPAIETGSAAAAGLLNLASGDWHQPLLAALGLSGLHWPPVVAAGTQVGTLTRGEHHLACYAPLGDQQCALAGAALTPGELSVNMGTGSQVSLLRTDRQPGAHRVRPFFGGLWLHTLADLPAGRALSSLVNLLTELARAEGFTPADPWGTIARAAEQTGESDLEVDLAFFADTPGAAGSISNIREDNLTVGTLFAATFTAMAENYRRAARELDPAGSVKQLVLSGGLAHNLPPLRERIAATLGLTYRLAPAEDTLHGLLNLARQWHPA